AGHHGLAQGVAARDARRLTVTRERRGRPPSPRAAGSAGPPPRPSPPGAPGGPPPPRPPRGAPAPPPPPPAPRPARGLRARAGELSSTSHTRVPSLMSRSVTGPSAYLIAFVTSSEARSWVVSTMLASSHFSSGSATRVRASRAAAGSPLSAHEACRLPSIRA